MEISAKALTSLVREVDDQHRDGMATIGDQLAEVHAITRSSRRSFLAKAGVGGLAVTIGSAVVPMKGLLGVAAAQEQEQELDDADLAKFAQGIELAAVEAYKAAAATGKITDKAVLDAANTFAAHHAEHAAAFGAFTKEQGTPNARLLKVVGDQIKAASDQNGLVTIAYDVENAAASTYLFSLGVLTIPQTRAAVASILPIESSHAATLGFVLGKKHGKSGDPYYLPTFETQSKALDPATLS